MIYISFLAILLDQMKSSSLAADFQGLYSSALLNINNVDVKNSRTDWLKMFEKLGCCGVESVTNSISVCRSSDSNNTCWEKFSDNMTTYSSSYITLASLSFMLQIIQLSFCDIIHSQLSGQKLPFAMARSFTSKIRSLWKRSWKLTLISTCRLLSCVPAIAFVSLGSILLCDDLMTGYYVQQFYSLLYVVGVNFNDIVSWFGIIMIILGAMDLTLNLTMMLADLIMPESRTKHVLWIVLNFIILVLKIMWLGLCIKIVLKMSEDLRMKMAYLLRRYPSNVIGVWTYLFGELQCCGITSSNDICSFRTTSTCSYYPFTCCNTLYETTEHILGFGQEVHYSDCKLSKMGCRERILDIFQFYTTGFFVAMSVSIFIGIVATAITIMRLKSLHSTKINVKKSADRLHEKGLRVTFMMYCKSDYSKVLIWSTSILGMIFGFIFLAEGIILAFDGVFNHNIIKQALFSHLEFDGVSFNQIRQSLFVFMLVSGAVLIIFCGIGFVTLGTKSRSLHISQAVIVGISLILMIAGVSLWGKTFNSIKYEMGLKMLEYMRKSYLYDASFTQFLDASNAISAWGNLFAQAECCGVNAHDGTDFPFTSGQKIPIYCCKENPLTDPSKTSNDNCTNVLEPNLRHNTSCKDAILTRLDAYSNIFLSISGLVIPCLFVHLSVILYRLCRKTYILHQNDRELIKWRTLFLCLATLSSISMVVLGVLLKEDNKMTGTVVHNIYQYLYFNGANYNDILEAMYVSLIVLGVLSFSCSTLGISELFKTMKNEVKHKIYVALLAILIATKIVCVSLMITIHAEIDTYSNKTSYQFLNMDRQYANGYVISSQLNRFYLELDCCGSTGSYGFWELVTSAGYGSSYNSWQRPSICCLPNKNIWSNDFTTSFCEKSACGEKLFALVNFYNEGLMSSMSVTALFEIICLLLSLRYLYNQRQPRKDMFTESLKKQFLRYPKSQHLGMSCAVLIMMLSIGFFAESAALRYDEIFANKQIHLLFEKIIMAGNSFNKNIIIMRLLLNTTGCLFFLSATFSILTIYQKSKFSHSVSIVMCVIGISIVLSNLAWWIAVHAEGFNSNLSEKNEYQPFKGYLHYSDSTLSGGYQMNINGAWNNLFVKLKCCGYLYGNDGDFGSFYMQDGARTQLYANRTSLFCCHSNPLTENYNSAFDDCTAPEGSIYRYTESCSGKLSKKLQQYSIAFCIMAVLAIVSQVTFIVVLRKRIKRDPPLRKDHVLLKIKFLFASRRKQMKNVGGHHEDLGMSIKDKTYQSMPLDKSMSQISTMNNSYSSAIVEGLGGSVEKPKTKRGKRRDGKVYPLQDGEIPNQGFPRLPPLRIPQEKP